MNALNFIKYLGYSSNYTPLDDFLTENGIRWRPNIKRNLDTTYFIKNSGIALSFTIGADTEGIMKKSEGDFIFNHLGLTLIEENKNDGVYCGSLPEALSISDTRCITEKKLGNPKRKLERVSNYYINDLIFTLAFAGENIRYLQIDVPDDGWRMYGICP